MHWRTLWQSMKNGIAFYMVFPSDSTEKYEESAVKTGQMVDYFNYFDRLALTSEKHSPQPFIFYIDARWGSLEVMKALQQRRMHGVLSIGENAYPKPLWPWIKSDLAKHDWWSIGNPQLESNLVCIRTKKKSYVKLLTNWASLDATEYEKQRRKYPKNKYVVEACAVQVEYNAYKCKVDQFNKAILEYYRLSMPVNENVTFTQFFFHVFTVQAWNYFNCATSKKVSQLTFRESLLRELSEKWGPVTLPPRLGEKKKCWAISKNPQKSRCQYLQCPKTTTRFCVGCEKWGCEECLLNAHT